MAEKRVYEVWERGVAGEPDKFMCWLRTRDGPAKEATEGLLAAIAPGDTYTVLANEDSERAYWKRAFSGMKRMAERHAQPHPTD